MGYKCSAPGCKSGYKGYDSKGKYITMHRFPSAPDVLAEWLRRLPRQNFTPTPSSRLCSVHFQDSDFVTESCDTNKYRHRKVLVVRRLKTHAVPCFSPTDEPMPPATEPTPISLVEKRRIRQKKVEEITCEVILKTNRTCDEEKSATRSASERKVEPEKAGRRQAVKIEVSEVQKPTTEELCSMVNEWVDQTSPPCAKLLEEDLGVPGISQISRAVLDRFASEITLYPDPHEVAALSETLNLHPVLVQSYFNKMALNLTSAPPSACETAADFKVPGTSKRPHPKNSRPPTSAKRPRIWVASATTVVLPESSLNVSAAARKTPSPSPAVVSATDESQSFTSTPVAVLKSRENEAIPVPSVKKDAKMGQQPHQLPEDIWVWPAMNSSPLKRDEEAAGVETEDSFVRGLLASPPSGHGGSPLPQAEVFEDRFPSALNTPGPPDEEECGF